jgi:hypothetical protein
MAVGVELLLGLVLNLVILYSTGRGGTAKCLRGGVLYIYME